MDEAGDAGEAMVRGWLSAAVSRRDGSAEIRWHLSRSRDEVQRMQTDDARAFVFHC